jgi:hypothetical protein
MAGKARRCLRRGIGILPTIRGLEAHATMNRSLECLLRETEVREDRIALKNTYSYG